MDSTTLSSKGQVVIPKALRDAHDWRPGQEFVAIDTGDGVLLKAKRPFQPTELDEVAGSLRYEGDPITLEEMQQAIERGVKERQRDRD